ncbi:MAG: arsenosugar biosynthesis radical SAM (seleno)protein ArsS [Thermodesulfovibrionales bacterium]
MCDVYIPFSQRLKSLGKRLLKDRITTIQANLGNLCNQSCIHCHIEASPSGMQIMSEAVMSKIIGLLKKKSGLTLDITGGSPELHPNIRWFIKSAKGYASTIILRSNLTALNMSNGLLDFIYDYDVVLICSLPDLSEKKTDYQRGNGVFIQSINTLKRLNEMGYGIDKTLNLVHNPIDLRLSQSQSAIEKQYRETLIRDYGIRFHNLYVINNVPIGRFSRMLHRHKSYEQYMNLLSQSFNVDTIDGLMCRYILNIGYDGNLYDCDFNNALGLRISKDLQSININELQGNAILVGEHCYACTALSGGGCFGSVV